MQYYKQEKQVTQFLAASVLCQKEGKCKTTTRSNKKREEMGKEVSLGLLPLMEGSTPFQALLLFEPLFLLAFQLLLPLAVFRQLSLQLRLLLPELPVPATTSSLRKAMVHI